MADMEKRVGELRDGNPIEAVRDRDPVDFLQRRADALAQGSADLKKLAVEAVHDHSHGGHGRAGIHSGRAVSRRRAVAGSTAGNQAGHADRFLEPLYKGGLDDVTPGSSCIANAYSSNHDEIVAPETSTLRRLALHAVDGLALVHALLLRIQALLLPFKTLVFGGH